MAELEVKPEAVPNGLKRIDFETGILVGRSGKKYYTEGNLSVERYCLFQVYEKELAYGMTVDGIFKKLNEIFKLLDKMKFAQCSAMIFDMIHGAKKMADRQPAMMKICALYINAEDEDRGTINQDMIDKKISDWQDYAIADFFQVATRSVRGLTEIYESVVQAIMEQPTDLKN